MTDLAALLRELALPRPAGSVAQARVVETLKRELVARGFTVAEQRFTATPAGLDAVAVLGFVVAGMGAAVLTLGSGGTGLASGRYVLLATSLAILALGTPLRRAMLGRARGRRVEAVNLIATRGPAAPALWLAAHHDSKGQVFSMASRLVWAGLAALGGGGLVALALAGEMGAAVPRGAWLGAAWPAFLGGAPLMLNAVLRPSPGALDNGTGILAILAVLDRLAPQASVGVLLPDAEELGLVGARALVEERGALLRDAAVINFDGIDDDGDVIALVHRPGSLTEAVAAALSARRRRWLPVLVDGIVLGRAARECVTLMRGGWGTMRVVHTRRDTADRLSLTGVRAVADGVAAVLNRAPAP
ncbi:MAG TPA: M28 family peptidase [Gemmatimonadales bacterium]|nr:M28 family peptidase [Gemmatimonadales bacterium]